MFARVHNPYLNEALPHMNDWSSYEARNRLVRKFAWSVPTQEVLESICNFLIDNDCDSLVSIGCGTAYWESLIKDMAEGLIEVEAFEKYLNDNPYKHKLTWMERRQSDEQVLTTHKAKALFLAWPPYNEPMGANVIKAFSGNYLVYVGESWGGCCGDDEMFEELDDNWESVDGLHIPNWDGIHDRVILYKRKS